MTWSSTDMADALFDADGGEAPAFELHENQKGVYVECMLEEGVSHNILSAAYAIEGPFSRERLQRCLDRLVQRHEALRIGIRMAGDQPRQVVSPAAPLTLAYKDLSRDPPQTRGARIDEADEGNAIRPFDLARPPLMRASLLKLDGRTHVLFLAVHHIISDTWSLAVLQKELMALYRHLSDGGEGDPPGLAPLTRQFTDFTESENRKLAGGRYAELGAYWRTAMAAAHPLEFPTDFPLAGRSGGRGREIKFELGAELLGRLRRACRQERVTLFMFLLAAYDALLYQYTTQEDITITCPFSHRPGLEYEGVFGYFSNPLPLRQSVDPQMSFQSLLGSVKTAVIGALRGCAYPASRIVRDLGLALDARYHSFVDIAFGFDIVATDSVLSLGGGTVAREWRQKSVSVPANLMLFFLESDAGVTGTLSYNSALYGEESVRRILGHFRGLLGQVLDDPGRRVADLDAATDGDRARILGVFNRPRARYPSTLIHRMFEAQAARLPDRRAVQMGDAALTYSALEARANRVARELVRRGVPRNAIVGVLLGRSPDAVASFLGVLKAGCAYLPLDPDYPAARLLFMLRDCQAPCLVTTAAHRGAVEWTGESVLLDSLGGEGEEEGAPDVPLSPDDPAYVIFTSGTTGNPKGTLVTHRNVVRLMTNDESRFSFSERDVWTLFHSLCFDFSVWEMYGALLFGGRLVIIPAQVARDPRAFHAIVSREGVTVLNQTPSAFASFMDADDARPGALLRLRYVIFGGEPLAPATLRAFHAKYPAALLVNMYGITETTVHVTYKEIGDPEIGAGISNIGVPIPTLSVYVVSPSMKLLPVGIPGELCVAGDGVASGYVNRPELTAQKFLPDPFTPGQRMYRSGDRARWLANGEIEYLGRIDQQVKIRGFRIELAEIEARMLRFGGVHQVVAAAVQDGGAPSLCAYYVAERTVTAGEWRGFLGADLPAYMIPAHFMRIPSFPLTPNGKIDRRALPEPSGAVDTGSDFLSARSATEERLEAALQSILSVERVGMRDDFFEMGGDSLKAIRLVSRMEAHGYEMRIGDVFQYPVVGALAERLDARRTAEARIDDIAAAEAALRRDTGLSTRWTRYVTEARSVVVLRAEEADAGRILAWAGAHCGPQAMPHYLRAETAETAAEAGPLTEEGLAELLRLADADPFWTARRFVMEMRRAHDESSALILAGRVVREYPASPIQRSHFALPIRVSGTCIPVDGPLDRAKWEKAVLRVIREQGLMRSVLAEGGLWREREAPERFPIPWLDMSGIRPSRQDALLDAVFSQYLFKEFGEIEGRLLYRVVLISLNLSAHLLVLIFDHGVFDGFSETVLRNALARPQEDGTESAAPAALSYADYVEQTAQGPQGIEPGALAEQLRLPGYARALSAAWRGIEAMRKPELEYCELELPLPLPAREGGQGSELIWRRSFDLFVGLCAELLHLESVPVSLVYHGRRYGARTYTHLLGEFLDVVPVLIDGPSGDWEGTVRRTLELVSRHNVQFSRLCAEECAAGPWAGIRGMVTAGNLRLPMALAFNFIEKLDSEDLRLQKRGAYARLGIQKRAGLDELQTGLLLDVVYTAATVQFSLSATFGPPMAGMRELLRRLAEARFPGTGEGGVHGTV